MQIRQTTKGIGFWSKVLAVVSASVFSISVFAETKTVRCDGSSTVFPITEAMAEKFGEGDKSVRVVVGESGTGGGFKRFCKGEIDVSNASRLIKDSEVAECKANKIEFVAIPVAYDGITVVVNKSNTFAKSLTKAELQKIWEPGSKVKLWSEIRAEWPKEKIRFYGPGTASGTFDFFTEAINGKAQLSRKDFSPSEDDNTLVQGVSGDKYSLGYFGYSYFHENANRLNAVAIDNGQGPIMPDGNSIESGKYSPLSRTIFIYVSKASLARPEVAKFVKFYVDNVNDEVKKLGFIPLSKKDLAKAKEVVKLATGGK
jgi:phosphate transport system substrate-binding protein